MDPLNSYMPTMDPGSLTALTNALRGQSEAGTIGMMSGFPSLQQAGKAQIGQADQLTGIVQQAGGQALSRAMQAQHMAIQQAHNNTMEKIGLQNADTRANTAKTVTDAFGRPYAIYPDRSIHQINGETGGGLGGGGGGGDGGRIDYAKLPISKEALDMLSDNYATDRTLPAISRGRGGQLLQMGIIQNAKDRHPDLNPAVAAAINKAEVGNLTKLTATAGQMEAFEATAKANLDTMMEIAAKLDDTGSPWLNRPIRELAAKAAGDPDVAAFLTAREVATAEAAKVLTSTTGAGVLSDSARHEMQNVINQDGTLRQMAKSVHVILTDFANRKAAYANAILAAQGKIRPHGDRAPPADESGGASNQTQGPPTQQGPALAGRPPDNIHTQKYRNKQTGAQVWNVPGKVNPNWEPVQ